MTGGDDDYGDAFKEAKLEHDQRRQGSAEEQRLQAATRRIKADPALRLIPIIAVTSYALSGEENKARAAGCDDYVPKPFSPRELLAKIRQYLPE